MKIGLSSCEKDINEVLFQNYQKAGITHMEISCGVDQYDSMNYQELARLANNYGICLWSCHLPFWTPDGVLDISDLDEAKRQKTVTYHTQLMQKCAAIGIHKFILHPSSEPISDEIRRQRMEKAKESIAYLAEQAKNVDSILAVENLPRSCLGRCSDEILELISVHPNAHVCFDTNHLLIEAPETFLNKVGNKIVTTHISDYDFVNERHWLPGEGKINWSTLYSLIRDINNEGVWMYEISFNCPVTILRDRPLCCSDFVNNANEIFSGMPFTILSTPKPNLGMWE